MAVVGTGVPTDFAAFTQGNQDGSGAPGFGPAGSQPVGSDAGGDRARRRTRPGDGEDDFGYQRIPAASPRTTPYGDTGSGGPSMDTMFRQFMQFMVQGMNSAGGEAVGRTGGSPGLS